MEAANVYEIYDLGNVFRTDGWTILPHTDIRACLEHAYRVADQYGPGHSAPSAGDSASATRNMKHIFSGLACDWNEFASLTDHSNFLDLVPGRDREVFMVFRADDYIGSFFKELAFEDKDYTVERVDGSLRAVGPVDRVKEMTRFFSAAFVPVEIGDGYGTEEYALVGTFPGLPDVGKQFLEGLKEGDRIDGSEVKVRRLPLVEPEKTNESSLSPRPLARIVPPSFGTAPKDIEPSEFSETDVQAYLNYAYGIANKYKTGFIKPLAGHIPDFKGFGARENKSLFYKLEKWPDFTELAKESVALEMVPGINRQVFLVFSSKQVIGYHVVIRAFDHERYTVKRIDGRLKAIGPVDMVKEDTGLFSVAFAPVVKLGDDYGDEEFGLFRAFPGRPEIHPFTKGLEEGDVISGAEVNARRLQPAAPGRKTTLTTARNKRKDSGK